MILNDNLIEFWKTIDKETKFKETLLDRYIKNQSCPEILRFIKLGGGPRLGSLAEKYARYVFDFKNRLKGNTNYDHILYYNNISIKIEQKTSTLNTNNDYLWQHISYKHPWDLLLLMGISYDKIAFYAFSKKTFHFLLNQGKITNQGSKNNDSHQGFWFKYSNVRNNITQIYTQKDIIDLFFKDS